MKFVVLIDFTDKARQNPKSIQEFSAKMSEGAKSIGITIEQRYWGIGGMHDIVVVLDAPDGNAIAKLITKGQASGNAVPKVMRVWTDEERAEIVKSVTG
jgi:uncharacterized protein with GYD domain